MKYYTPEEINNNYEFKIIRRILKEKYPWIIDVIPNDVDIKFATLIFIDIILDHKLLSEIIGYDLRDVAKHSLKNTGEYNAPILNSFYEKNATTVLDHLHADINHKIGRIHKSIAFPPNLKIDRNVILVGQFITYKK